jgi:hypothetical protein|nr:LamG domain-containing protein [Kofleriaceae bacterium]
MRSLALAVLGVLGGCSFTPAGSPGNGVDAGGVGNIFDAGSGVTPIQPPGGSPPPCSVSDPSLTLCLDFEGSVSPTAVDSSPDHRDAATLGVTPVARGGEQAIAVTAQSAIGIPGNGSAIMSVPISIEMFAMTTKLPAKHSTFVDSELFSITLYPDGSISCDLDDSASGGTLAVGAWTHLACTFDGHALRAYVNGDVVGCQNDTSVGGPLSEDSGLMALGNELIGDRPLTGGLDDVHVYAELLSDAAVCSRAGRTGCNTKCPSN